MSVKNRNIFATVFLIKLLIILILPHMIFFSGLAQNNPGRGPASGFESRITKYVDSLRVIDTHEHLFTEEIVKGSSFLDFMLLFQPNGYDDLISAGMPQSHFDSLYNESLSPLRKWKLIEPYWKNSFNTSFNRIILQGARNLYGINDLNENTVAILSDKIRKSYNSDHVDRILRDSCRIDYVIQDGYFMPGKDEYFRYAKRFDDWILIKSKYRIDSLAILQLDPIYTLEDLVKSMRLRFEAEMKKGMTVVKVFLAYSRPLKFENTGSEAARKVFRSLVNGNEDKVIPFREAKPLQDYMLHRLLDLACEYRVPVAFHTGLQSGDGNYLENSNPLLLSGLFKEFPGVNFVIYHGSYPFGGEIAVLAKTYKNVYLDMNWIYSISPSYSERYLNEWLETVPVSKLIGFGGDAMVVENVYSELITARKIISQVLSSKIMDGYITENEAKTIARMILRENASRLYNLP